MSEQYFNYRYTPDESDIDIYNDSFYDYVLEREELKELDNVGPQCMRRFGGEYKEHFGNMNRNTLLKNIMLVIAIVVIICVVYSLCGNKSGLNYPPGDYVANLTY